MASSRLTKLQFLLIACLLFVTLFKTTSACRAKGHSRRPFRYHPIRFHPYRRYQTTTERYYGKRSVDNADYNEFNNEVGNVDNERTSCGQTLCPKVLYYPRDEIIEAVDRLHQHLYADDSHRKDFANKGMDANLFYTSERSKTLFRRPNDHWFLSDPTGGCKQRASVMFPQQGYSNNEGQTYYVVNVPNLRQSVVQYTCNNAGQTCSKDAQLDSYSARKCQQSYSKKQFVVLPMNQRRFNIQDFKVVSITVPDSCSCKNVQDSDDENMIG